MKYDIIAFSDVHLGIHVKKEQEYCKWGAFLKIMHLWKEDITDAAAFCEFVKALSEEPPKNLVILGDLLEFWRKTNHEVLCRNHKVLKALFSLNCKIYYVVGNHDYLIYELAQKYKKNFQKGGDIEFCKDIRLMSGREYIFFTHGYDLDVQINYEMMGIEMYESFAAVQCRATNSLGGLVSTLWNGKTWLTLNFHKLWRKISIVCGISDKNHKDEDDMIKNITISGLAHLFCGAQPGDLLVFGHTHRPFIDHDHVVANTGSWCEDIESLCKERVQGITHTGSLCEDIDPKDNNEVKYNNRTYVTINNGIMELKTFVKGKPL